MVELSEQQREVVESKYNNIIVDAGSGSGKTRVLTERVRKILSEGADPRGIVVITYTNLATNELRNRLMNVKNSLGCFIGTIHSYANHILKQTRTLYNVYTPEIEYSFMQELISKYAKYCSIDDYKLYAKFVDKYLHGKMTQYEIRRKMSSDAVYNELQYLLGERENIYYPESVKTLCKRENVITFDEMIEYATAYLKENNIKLEHLFVDEFQDISFPEYKFLLGLKSVNNFFIGDDYQAIYRFRGGDVSIFLSLMNHKDWKSHFLSENYRTATSIIQYADSMIKKSPNVIKKDLVIKNTEQGSLEFVARNLFENFIKSLKNNDDFMILCRTNKDVYNVSTMLKKYKKQFYLIKRDEMSDEMLSNIMKKKCIKLMTIHSSKGLECDNVALYGRFPINGKSSDYDELNVFYVGITRSKSRCVICV